MPKQEPRVHDPADLAYLRAHYSTLERLCVMHGYDAMQIRREISSGLRPRASYISADGTEYFPLDYLVQRTSAVSFSAV